MSSSCFESLDIRSPGVFTETFLDHYHLDICKSNAKTHKIISINRFGITCFYFSSRNVPAIALFAATFLSNLVLSRSNQWFGCGLDQSHCRKLHIQIWLWPGLIYNVPDGRNATSPVAGEMTHQSVTLSIKPFK